MLKNVSSASNLFVGFLVLFKHIHTYNHKFIFLNIAQECCPFYDVLVGVCRMAWHSNLRPNKHYFVLPYFFSYKTEFFLPKQSQNSRSIL